ncbi:hypothetical protein UlMin_018183 [Ulmus minor]
MHNLLKNKNQQKLLTTQGIELQEPQSYEEAIRCPNSKEWKIAMKSEMNSLAKNRTWELVSKPPNQKVIDCKWLYKIKEGTSQEEKRRYKARLVAKGFTQRE